MYKTAAYERALRSVLMRKQAGIGRGFKAIGGILSDMISGAKKNLGSTQKWVDNMNALYGNGQGLVRFGEYAPDAASWTYRTNRLTPLYELYSCAKKGLLGNADAQHILNSAPVKGMRKFYTDHPALMRTAGKTIKYGTPAAIAAHLYLNQDI